MIKNGDFIELDYTGKIKDENQVFDTTIQKVAEEADLIHKHEEGQNHDHSDMYSPVIVCVGQKHLLPGLDKKIEGKDLGKYSIELSQEEAFGKKNAKLLTTFPSSFFKKQEIKPYVGLQLTFDNGSIGIVRSAGAGRVMVDFNHPLSGKELVYDVNIKKIVTDKEEQLKGLFKIVKIPFKSYELKENKVTVLLEQELPEKYLDALKEDVKKLIGFDVEYKKPAKVETKKQ